MRDRPHNSKRAQQAEQDGATVTVLEPGSVRPHDAEAERSVLGASMLDQDAHRRAAEILPAGAEFYVPAHGEIWDAMRALDQRGAAIDPVTVAGELRARSRLDAAGGPEFLGALTDVIPTIAHVEQHARMVADMAHRRRLIAFGLEVIDGGHKEERTLDETLDTLNARCLEVMMRKSRTAPTAMSELIEKAFTDMEAHLQAGRRIRGVSTGFRELDTLLSGLQKGQLIVVAARPAMGKTSLVGGLAVHVAATEQKPVLFLSLEMPKGEIVNRLLCGEARVDQNLFRSMMLGRDEMQKLSDAGAKLFQLPLFIDDDGECTVLQVRAKARRLKQEHGDIGLIVIDYLQLMKGSRDDMESREREVSEISRGLKSLAKELEVPIVALSQLNRSPETRSSKDKRPQLSDLRESGAVEQDADVVVFIYRDEVYNKETEDRGIAELIVAKQRSGPPGTVRTRFIRELTRFEPLAHEDDPTAPDAAGSGEEDSYAN